MKKLIPLMLAMSVFSAYADTLKQTQESNSAADAVASNTGNTQSIIFTSPGTSETTVKQNLSGDTTTRIVSSGTQTVKNVPSVSGPNLVSSNDTCHGSVSGSVNFAGFGGGVGKTVLDKNCVMLKNARELWNMGMRAAALARMCMDPENKAALELTGFTCPQTNSKTVSSEMEPVITQRLGIATAEK